MMEYRNICIVVFLCVFLTFSGYVVSDSYCNDEKIMNEITIKAEDLPEGFTFGQVPQFAKKIFPLNPCVVDANAVRFLSGKIYPGGNAGNIKSIYAAIITHTSRPFGDDIVCYVIAFTNSNAAATEIKKINEFLEYNKDRMIVVTKDTIAAIVFADDTNNYKYVAQLGEKLKSKLYQ